LKIEEAGGFVRALKSGLIQDEIEETVEKRNMDIATRKDIFLGVNQYPNPAEKSPGKIDGGLPSKNLTTKGSVEALNSIDSLREYLAGRNAGIGDVLLSGTADKGFNVKPLKPYRGPEVFEEMRLRTLEYAKETGKTPAVFLLPVGNISMRNARANFSSNFFGCAGFKIIENRGFETIEKGIKAALKSGAPIVVVCSSDREYPDLAPGIAEEIKSAKPDTCVVIAGYPEEHIDELRDSGVDEFIHAGSNALEELKKFQTIAGIGGGEPK
jgi:methylmalonyl-CoA mutase